MISRDQTSVIKVGTSEGTTDEHLSVTSHSVPYFMRERTLDVTNSEPFRGVSSLCGQGSPQHSRVPRIGDSGHRKLREPIAIDVGERGVAPNPELIVVARDLTSQFAAKLSI